MAQILTGDKTNIFPDLQCCWQKGQVHEEECLHAETEDPGLRSDRRERFLKKCLECPRFWEQLPDSGPGLQVLAELFPSVAENLLNLRSQVQSLSQQLEVRNREVKFLHEVSLVLQTSADIDEVIALALTAVTAGQGFGFNRAILFLVDSGANDLRGHFAIGPRDRSEAGKIWQEIAASNLSLRDMARTFFEEKMQEEKSKFADLLQTLTVSLDRSEHLFVQTLENRATCHLTALTATSALDADQADALGVEELVLVPLVTKNRPIGLLLADNIVNRRPIDAEDIHLLETFSFPVSFALDRAGLYEQLQAELDRLTAAHRRLQEQQETILRMEKMAAVAKVSADIAHSVRNPLTVIGGFARSLLKGNSTEPVQRQFLESIVREVRRMEETLKEAMAFAENQHPSYDWWDLNQLLTRVFASLQDNIKMGGFDCRLDFQSHMPLVRLDYPQISFCLRTMLRHTLDALPEGESLVIGTRSDQDGQRISIRGGDDASNKPDFSAIVEPLVGREGDPGLRLCRKILTEHGARAERGSGVFEFMIWFQDREKPTSDPLQPHPLGRKGLWSEY